MTPDDGGNDANPTHLQSSSGASLGCFFVFSCSSKFSLDYSLQRSFLIIECDSCGWTICYASTRLLNHRLVFVAERARKSKTVVDVARYHPLGRSCWVLAVIPPSMFHILQSIPTYSNIFFYILEGSRVLTHIPKYWSISLHCHMFQHILKHSIYSSIFK